MIGGYFGDLLDLGIMTMESNHIFHAGGKKTCFNTSLLNFLPKSGISGKKVFENKYFNTITQGPLGKPSSLETINTRV